MLSALIISFSTDFPFSKLIYIYAGLCSYPTFLCLHGCVSLNVFVCLQKLWLVGGSSGGTHSQGRLQSRLIVYIPSSAAAVPDTTHPPTHPPNQPTPPHPTGTNTPHPNYHQHPHTRPTNTIIPPDNTNFK